MDLISAFTLFFGIFACIDRQPVYQIDHFYYYNAEHKQIGLPLQGGVLAPNGPGLQDFIDAGKHGEATVKKLEKSQFEGVVFVCDDNRKMLELLRKLSDKKIEAYPIVKFSNMLCVPSDTVLVKTKKHVTEATLKQRLKHNGKLVVDKIDKAAPYTYQIKISKMSLPPNILVTANMLAEDTAWFEHARAMFRPIYQPVVAWVVVERPASSTVGEERLLKLVIEVHKPSIKILKDTIPSLGHNKWIPQPQTLDVWCEFGKPSPHKVEATQDGYMITITQPFRFYSIVPIIIPPAGFVYEDDDGEKYMANIQGCKYRNSSLLAGTNIDDIQPRPPIGSLPLLDAPEPLVPETSLYGYRPLLLYGMAMVGVGSLVLVLLVLAKANRFRINTLLRWAGSRERARYWNELESTAFHLNAGDNWRLAYQQVTDALSNVLSEFYDVKRPLSALEHKDTLLQSIVGELELFYKSDYEPNEAAVAALVANLNTFVKERVKFNV